MLSAERTACDHCGSKKAVNYTWEKNGKKRREFYCPDCNSSSNDVPASIEKEAVKKAG